MRSLNCQLKPGPEDPAGSDIPPCPTGWPAAITAPATDRGAVVGMGTKNFVVQILDIYAVLSKGRKQALIDYSSQLAREQQAERQTVS